MPTGSKNSISLDESEFLNRREAERFSKMSYATLRRRHQEGVEVGLRRRFGRVIFDKAALRAFLSQSDSKG